MSLQVGSGFHPLHLDRGLSDKREKFRLKRIVSKPDGSVGPANGTTAMYRRVSPYIAIDNASHQVFDLMRRHQCAVYQGKEDRDSTLLGKKKGLRAIDSYAYPVIGLVERVEELEDLSTLPRFEINLNGTGAMLLEHDSMVYTRKN